MPGSERHDAARIVRSTPAPCHAPSERPRIPPSPDTGAAIVLAVPVSFPDGALTPGLRAGVPGHIVTENPAMKIMVEATLCSVSSLPILVYASRQSVVAPRRDDVAFGLLQHDLDLLLALHLSFHLIFA